MGATYWKRPTNRYVKPYLFAILRDHAPDMFTTEEAVDLWLKHRPDHLHLRGRNSVRRCLSAMKKQGLLQSPTHGMWFVSTATEWRQWTEDNLL